MAQQIDPLGDETHKVEQRKTEVEFAPAERSSPDAPGTTDLSGRLGSIPPPVPGVRTNRPIIQEAVMVMDITWTELPSAFDIAGYNVYRAVDKDRPVDDWEKRNVNAIEVDFFRDTDTRLVTNWDWWFKVTSVNNTGVESPLEDATPVTMRPDARGLFHSLIPVIRDRAAIITNPDGIGTGEEIDFYIRKRAGAFCSSCYDERDGSRLAECPECLGTGYQGGYVSIPDLIVRIRSTIELVTLAPVGFKVDSRPQMVLSGPFPKLHDGDVVYRKALAEYFLVQDARPRSIQGLTTTQLSSLQEVSPWDNPYALLSRGA